MSLILRADRVLAWVVEHVEVCSIEVVDEIHDQRCQGDRFGRNLSLVWHFELRLNEWQLVSQIDEDSDRIPIRKNTSRRIAR